MVSASTEPSKCRCSSTLSSERMKSARVLMDRPVSCCHNKRAMTELEMEAVTGGYHGDPFAVLGPHMIGRNGRTEWEIHAFLPQAAEAAVLLNGAPIPME